MLKSSFTIAWRNLLRKNPALLNADFNIIETLSLADWFFLLRLRRKNIYYIIHDPQPHTGEGRGRTEKINNLYFPKIQKFITYSQFSTRLFRQHYPAYANKVLTFKMPVFTSQKVELKTPPLPSANKKIVFFGRISPYKGVELFYEAAVKISAQQSNVSFIIAGKAYDDYNPDFLHNNTNPAIAIRNRFIGLDELAEIMGDADLCVLPYFDATQSGVIMTCYAFNLPVLVSNCEGLLEYCFDKDNFSFENKNLNSLVEKMQALINNPTMLLNNRKQIESYAGQNVSLMNSDMVIAEYNSLVHKK